MPKMKKSIFGIHDIYIRKIMSTKSSQIQSIAHMSLFSQVPVACVPVPCRTDPEIHRTHFDFKDYKSGRLGFLIGNDQVQINYC